MLITSTNRKNKQKTGNINKYHWCQLKGSVKCYNQGDAPEEMFVADKITL